MPFQVITRKPKMNFRVEIEHPACRPPPLGLRLQKEREAQDRASFSESFTEPLFHTGLGALPRMDA
jgi:hypothetical protein